MKNSISIAIPPFVQSAFPLLNRANYIRSFAPIVPLYPDTTFYLFYTIAGDTLVLVETDHPAPHDDRSTLRKLSQQYAVTITHVLRPYANDETIEIHRYHQTADAFVVADHHGQYYYLAKAVQSH